MANPLGRVSFFDNRDKVAENSGAPVMTGKLEIEDIDRLVDELSQLEPRTYTDKNGVEHTVYDIRMSLWHDDGPSQSKLFSGEANIWLGDRKAASTESILPPVIHHEQTVNSPERSELAALVAEAKDVELEEALS